MDHPPALAETCEAILREQEPNFFRLYLNPHVAQACFCLDRYVGTTWAPAAPAEDCQSFLANGLEEALSGAIKLARYNRPAVGPRAPGLVFDPAGRLDGFVAADLPDGARVEFLPGLRVVGKDAPAGGLEGGVSLLVLVSGADRLLEAHAATVRRLVRAHQPLVITCLDRDGLAALRGGAGGLLSEIPPDIVVFDESFAGHAVPFGAFTARKALFAGWNRPGKATFHSTTFQPNTISTRHFMRCLAHADPALHDRLGPDLRAILTDASRRADAFRRYYHPALFRLIRASGFFTPNVRAAGAFLVADGRPVFDTVGGVACSIRGHNPTTYAEEMRGLSAEGAPAVEDELGRRLRALTGLEHVLPAVSGGNAVENALRLALVAQFPKRHVLALKAGFGGKTLLALTGTARPSYKERVGPLYAEVSYVDPFAPDALEQIDAALGAHEVAVVQLELIQSVGGVRRVPERVVRHLDEGRKRWGYLLLADEVQTGMYRTGPFSDSQTLGFTPDLMLLGKGTSDMMFPFALTLYSAAVRAALGRHGSNLADTLKQRYGYEEGFKTVLNVLRLAEASDAPRQVAAAGALFARLLNEGLPPGGPVREVRVFGLLIGIELDTSRGPRRWLRKRLAALYLVAMLRHERFAVFAGLCQYEPNVLKVTPPLNASETEVRRACATIIDVLNRPLLPVFAAGLAGLLKFSLTRNPNHEHRNDAAPEPAAC